MARIILISLLSIFYIPLSYAGDCFFSYGTFNAININVGSIQVPVDSPVGTVLLRKEVAYDSLTAHQGISCSTDKNAEVNFIFYANMVNEPSALSDVYKTNIEGIGIKISMYVNIVNGGFPQVETPLPFSSNIIMAACSDCNTKNKYNNFGSANTQVVIELIKISDITDTGALTYVISDFTHANSSDTGNILSISSLSLSGEIKKGTCDISTLTPSKVDLGSITSGSLGSIGAVAKEVGFSIILQCNGSPNVMATFSDKNSSPSPTEGILGLDSSSAAEGIGVQLLYQNVPVELGETISVETSVSSLLTIPLNVRVIQTKSAVTNGIFSAGVIYTFSYQ
ncbi:TPA: fimbrial protein [Enterobacter hormaechei subsp. steigerwaltii]|nr:fimbrial protein [Enterobacter hormaechei subsp. steigerwaltii]